MLTENKVRVGNVENVSGELNIAGRDIYKGYTAEQVSILLTQITSTFQPKGFDGRCPYKGLDVFEEEDTDLFFGREKLVEDLVNRVKVSRTIFITGSSGSGKSSLVRAGLMPALKQGVIKNSDRWLYETMKPGPDALTQLGRVASGLAGTLGAGEEIRTKGLSDATILAQWCEVALKDSREKRVVIFIDQFEEVFTQISKEEERVAFLNLLLHAATLENGRVILLFAMRSDFISNCSTYPGLNAILNQQFIQIGAMQPDELVSAIAQPALRVGLHIDPDLIAQIINDMEGEPGALPLMQFALKDLFDTEQAKGGLIALKIDDYLQRGGIRKALERHADAEFNKLSKAERLLTENLFKGLVEIGSNTPDARRIAHFEEFVSADTSSIAFESVVRRLADARLISTDENNLTGRTITLAHEKLIEAWPWLRQLVNDNRQFMQLQNQILEDAIEWEKQGKDKSYLYTGTRLIGMQKRLRDFQIKNEKAKLFLDASQAAHRHNQFQRGFSAGLLLMMGVAIYFAVIRPLLSSELNLQPVDLGGAGVNALQILPDGTVYAGMYNNPIKGGAPCLAKLAAGTNQWERFGPTCTNTVIALWTNPSNARQMYFSQFNDGGLYRTEDGGQNWQKIGPEHGLPMKNISSVVGTVEGVLFAGDLDSTAGIYESTDLGKTWQPLNGSPNETIFTLLWVPQQGLLVGGNGGLWLWNPKGEWKQLIALDITKKDQRILSVTVLPGNIFTVLAGGDNGIYLWKEGDPVQSLPKNNVIQKAWSMSVVSEPEPYVIAQTFPDSKIWRMTLDGENPHEMKAIGSDGFPFVVQNENPLRLWIGTVDGLYAGEFRRRALDLFNQNK